jgi:hypothetical protein
MGDWEWFERNVVVDHEGDRRAEEKAMKKEAEKKQREQKKSEKKSGFFK